MRFKIVPEPPVESNTSDERADGRRAVDVVAVLERAARAVPLVPTTEDECCMRLLDRLELAARDDAREWLTFLRALGLVTDADSGFHRSRDGPAFEELVIAFRGRIYGTREVLEILDAADGPLSTGAVVERFAEHVPRWERFRYPDPEEVWGERVARILDWAVWFGVAARADERYLPADGSPDESVTNGKEDR